MWITVRFKRLFCTDKDTDRYVISTAVGRQGGLPPPYAVTCGK